MERSLSAGVWIRGVVAGLAGGAAWRVAMQLIFGAAQSILADPARQSPKMLAVFGLEPPMPRMYDSPEIVWWGLLAIGAGWGCAYVAATRRWSGSWFRRGTTFGVLAWVLMVPWFEFYLPWNVLREPADLVLLELACWAGVMLVVGLTIAGVDQLIGRWPTAARGR